MVISQEALAALAAEQEEDDDASDDSSLMDILDIAQLIGQVWSYVPPIMHGCARRIERTCHLSHVSNSPHLIDE